MVPIVSCGYIGFESQIIYKAFFELHFSVLYFFNMQ
jgi:hypothetical protein